MTSNLYQKAKRSAKAIAFVGLAGLAGLSLAGCSKDKPLQTSTSLNHDGEFRGFPARVGIDERGFRYVKLNDTTSFLSSRGYIPAQLEWVFDREGHPINYEILHPAIDWSLGQIPIQESNPIRSLANPYDMEVAYDQITRGSQ